MRWVLLVLAALVLLAVWIAAILVPELRVVAEWTTAAVVFIGVAYLLVRWAIRRVKADAMEKELTKVPTAAPARPEVAELAGQMQRGFAALKAARRSKSAVYEIPWYVIVGPPATGKTTALQQSGLTFVTDALGSPKVRGMAGTRNCDWWLSPEAVLLDTAGRYAGGGDDHEEWLAFLDTLARLRADRPIDGLMVAVSVNDIVGVSEDQRAELAGRLRARLAEIVDRLEMVAPVYLLVTKADLIGGFVESMSGLGKAERGQVWGASFALDDPRLAEPASAVEAEIDRLAHNLHARVLDILPLERNPLRRARLLQLPLELSGLGPSLAQFADALFKPRGAEEHLVFRGFYLSSGTQVGQPVDRALSDMARGFGLAAASPPGDLQSYFLTDLFRAVMLPDRHLAVRSSAASQRRSRRELRAALIAVAVAAFFLVPAIVSYVRNVQIATAADAVARLPAASEPGTRRDPIEAMVDLVEKVEQETGGLSVPGWFGPRAANALLAPLEQAYLGRLDTELVARVRPELDRRLHTVATTAGFADAPVSPEDRTPLSGAYETVKLYTMLVSPSGHVDPPWAAALLVRIWQTGLPVSDAVPTERLVEHARRYLEGLGSGRVSAWPAPATLQGARERLRRSDVRGVPYRRTLLAASDVPPVRVSEMFAAASLEFLDCRGDVQIPGAFTAAGWEKVRADLDSLAPWPKAVVVEQWVVDDADVAPNEQALRAQVRSQYFDDYVRHWMAFLDELKVRTPPDLTAAKAELRALKEPDGFYKALFAQFKANAIHDAPPATPLNAAKGLLSKLPWVSGDSGLAPKDPGPSPVERAFRPLLAFSGDPGDGDKGPGGGAAAPSGLEKYRLILERLKAALDSPKPTTADAQTQVQFAEAATGVDTLLDSVEEPVHARLRRLLMPPVMGTMTVAKTEGFGSASAEWKATVYAAYEELANKYPLKPAAPQAATFGDFAAFFKPDAGPLWAYVKGHLSDYVEFGGRGYVMKPGSDPLDPGLLACLNVAQDVTDALYPAGEDPGLKFTILADWTVTDVSEAKVWIGGKATPLGRGQWSAPLKWFGDDVKIEWTQAGQPTQQIGRRPFALYDLFKQMGGIAPAAGGRSGVYVGEFPPLQIKVRSASKVDPFQSNFYSRLKCPEQVQGTKP